MKIANQLLIITTLLFSLSFSLNISALQVLDGVDGEVLAGKISIKEPTRISVSGAKITKWFFNDGDLILEKDPENGQIFVKPTQTDKPINAFIVDDSGRTYTLLLEPLDIPAENIFIKDRSIKHVEPSTIERTGSYSKVVKNMVLAMALESAPNGIEVVEKKNPVRLWREVRFVLTKQYIGKGIVGETYLIQNISKKPLVLAEQEFFKRGVLAVSVENMNLVVGETTNVFVVREKGENE